MNDVFVKAATPHQDLITDPNKPTTIYPNLPKEHHYYGKGSHCSWPGIYCRCPDYVNHQPNCHWHWQSDWDRNPSCLCLKREDLNG